MADNTNSSGGMFSKLINPDTAQPKAQKIPKQPEPKPVEVVSVSTEEPIQSPTVSAPVKKTIARAASVAEKTKKNRRKQISAYLTPEQLNLLKQLYFKLNSGSVEIEKSEIIGLGIELTTQLLSTQVPKYSSIHQVREYLGTQISKYLDTQVPRNSST